MPHVIVKLYVIVKLWLGKSEEQKVRLAAEEIAPEDWSARHYVA